MEISGEPPWGPDSDGRVAYEIRFDQPQRWAGLVRHWDNYYTITNFYNLSGNLIHSFQGIQQTHGGNKTFMGYLADSTDTNQWISRIECDGTTDSTGTRQVGYSDDLYFGTVYQPAPQNMTISSASVSYQSPKADTFTVKGTLQGLSLSGAQSVVFEASAFSRKFPWITSCRRERSILSLGPRTLQGYPHSFWIQRRANLPAR